MTPTDDQRRRTPRDGAPPPPPADPPVRRPTSRSRAGGAAQPVPPTSGRPPRPAGPPPVFAPQRAEGVRPGAEGAPIVVGRPPAPRPPAPGPAAAQGVGGPPAARMPVRRSSRPEGDPSAGPPTATFPAVGPAAARAPRPPAAARPGAGGPPPAVRPGSGRGPGQPAGPPTLPPRRRGRRRRRAAIAATLVIALLLAWPIGLALWANGRIEHVAALSGAAGTTGTTYLLAGSDSRADGVIVDTETTGARTDTIMLLHVPSSGPAALISLPRDTFVEIPGYGGEKLNASFAYGGPPLLVATVEQLSGLTVDHYVEIGFGGVQGVVDAVDGVELCLDYDVNEPLSGLVWTAGCHVSDGVTALAFARMRYADPEGDIGRARRQQQLIAAITGKITEPSLLVSPGRQVNLVRAGTDALVVSDGTGLVDLGRLALAFRSATGTGGITGTPPIASLAYQPGGIGSAVLLDADQTPAFWAGITAGTLPPGPLGGVPGLG